MIKTRINVYLGSDPLAGVSKLVRFQSFCTDEPSRIGFFFFFVL